MTHRGVRAREASDLPELARLLLEQQPTTRYPFRNPLPFPVEQFLHADDALAAFTAELDGQPVGHACRVGPFAADGEHHLNEVAARAHGCEIASLTWLSAVFVGQTGRGTGLGRQLLDAVVADACAHDAALSLEVLSIAEPARALYRSLGWREVARQRPDWLAASDPTGEIDVRVMVLDTDTGPAT